jgi:hypothetical protein
MRNGYLNDDAFITLTFAKNLATGRGFVYNHPPASLGTTTPLLALTIGGLAWSLPQVDLVAIAVWLTAFCWIGCIWTFYLFRESWGLAPWQVGVVGIVVLVGTGWFTALGAETYLFAFLLVLSFSLYLDDQLLWAGFCIGLLFLTRGEGVLLLPLLLSLTGFQCLTTRAAGWWTKALKLVVGFAVPAGLWLVYAGLRFGNPLPNSLAVKHAYAQTEWFPPFLTSLVDVWAPNWNRSFAPKELPALNLWWLVTGIGLGVGLMYRRQWLLYIAWIVLYIVGYSLLEVAGAWWYQLPILFVLQLYFALGVIACIELIRRWVRPQAAATALALLLVGWLTWVQAGPVVRNAFHYTGDGRGPSYTALSKWLRANTQETDRVAFVEIGYIGYFTDNRILDLAGLVNPEIVPHLAEGDFSWAFWHSRPEYYIYLPDFDWILGDIVADPRFNEEYEAVARLPGPRITDFVIYRRVTP